MDLGIEKGEFLTKAGQLLFGGGQLRLHFAGIGRVMLVRGGEHLLFGIRRGGVSFIQLYGQANFFFQLQQKHPNFSSAPLRIKYGLSSCSKHAKQ